MKSECSTIKEKMFCILCVISLFHSLFIFVLLKSLSVSIFFERMYQSQEMMMVSQKKQHEYKRFSGVLWHINPRGLFDVKSYVCSHAYIFDGIG